MSIEQFAFYRSAGINAFRFHLNPSLCLLTGERLQAWFSGYNYAIKVAVQSRYKVTVV